jgi:hypothetical protein
MTPTFLPTQTHHYPLKKVAAGFLLLAGIVGLFLMFQDVKAELDVNPIQQVPQPVNVAGFDHSQCQYPDRTTNPPNACDNSDPCDPANVKGGSGECIAQPESQQKPASYNIKTVEKPVDQVYNSPIRGK